MTSYPSLQFSPPSNLVVYNFGLDRRLSLRRRPTRDGLGIMRQVRCDYCAEIK